MTRKGKPSLRSIAARKGWATRRANALKAARRAAALKGWRTRRANERSAAAKRGWKTRRRNERERAKPTGAPQGGEEFDEYEAPSRVSEGYQSGGIYGGYEEQQEPAYIDFDGWDFDELEGLDSDADDSGDTNGEKATK
jgi:hypothetical protein